MQEKTAEQTGDGHDLKGMMLGLAGVTIFSVTLPATTIALVELGPVAVGLGRAILAAVVAGAILLFTRQKVPSKRDLGRLFVIAMGIVIGFPLFATIAMQTVPAAHGGVMLGILPLATAIAGTLVSGDRPSGRFWLMGLVGSGLVIAFAALDGATNGGWGVSLGDLWLLIAVLSAATGYALGGTLSRRLGGWQVICWALVVSLPVLIPAVFVYRSEISFDLSYATWAAFVYVALFSQLFGFFFWNRGLAIGGVARVGQTQLLQPFLTILFSVWLLGEALSATTVVFALLIVATVAISKRMPIAAK